MRPFRRIPTAFVTLLFGWLASCLWPVAAVARVPDWLAAAARQPTAADWSKARGAVLLDQTQDVVEDSGQVTTVHRYAVRILSQSGTDLAFSSVSYIDKTDKVRAATAWLVRAGKTVSAADDRNWVDACVVSTGVVYDEYRLKSLNCSDLAMIGDVFGYETRVVGRPLFAQFFQPFGGELPAVAVEYQIVVPAGWTVEASTENGDALAATVSADRRTWNWVRRNRAYRPDEPWPAPEATGPVIFGNYFPPQDSRRDAGLTFRSWGEVAAWNLQLADPQCDSDERLRALASRLTADCPDAPARVAALCRYVQNLQYIANNRNLGAGFGYRPRKSTEVVDKGFGDCKDKANALCALLREVGVKSHLVSVLSDESSTVMPAWPSPMQFNHVIVGIEVAGAGKFPAVLSTRQWGSLLIFDPTDASTPLGGMPWYLQGTNGLVIAPGSDGLVALPLLTPERDSLVERRVVLALSPTGGVSGKSMLTAYGQAGAAMRRQLRNATQEDLKRNAAEALAETLTEVQLKNVGSRNEPESDLCGLEYEFTSPRFAQPMPGAMALVHLDVLSRGHIPTFSEKSRETPVFLLPFELRDEVVLEVPPGFGVEECPEDIVVESPFGRCACSYSVQGGKITFRRSFSLQRQTVPLKSYPALRKFLSDALTASAAAALLHKS